MDGKSWHAAFDLYTRPYTKHLVSVCADKVVLHHNAAVAAFNLQHFAYALFHALVACKLQPNNPKSLVLKSAAYEAVGMENSAAEVSCNLLSYPVSEWVKGWVSE